MTKPARTKAGGEAQPTGQYGQTGRKRGGVGWIGGKRHDRGRDDRSERRVGPEDQGPTRPEECVDDERADRRVQPVDGLESGCLGVAHAHRDENRSQDDAADHVRDEPCALVAAQGRETRKALEDGGGRRRRD